MKEDGITSGLNTRERKRNHDHKRPDSRAGSLCASARRHLLSICVRKGDCAFSCYMSADLQFWEPVGTVFEIPGDFLAHKDVWAGEVHCCQGRYYLFVSLLGRNGRRGTQIAVSDSPAGPFLPLVDHAVTPEECSCIDGTLYVEDGTPFIVYPMTGRIITSRKRTHMWGRSVPRS